MLTLTHVPQLKMEIGWSGVSGASARPNVEVNNSHDKDNVTPHNTGDNHVKGRRSRHGIAIVSYLVDLLKLYYFIEPVK